MQAALTISMAAVAFLLPTSLFFSATLVCFWLMAFFSATHDIAADGYYMLELSEKRPGGIRRRPLHLLPHSQRDRPGRTRGARRPP